MRGRTGLAICSLLVAALVAIPGSPAQANQLGNQVVVQDTNFVSAGVGGMRGTGIGSITVAGVSGTVTKALLYWNGPTNTTEQTANASVSVNGQPVTGTNIGFSSPNCWPFDNSQSYRADVTTIVTGNGDYALTEFLKTTGETTVADINGASLIVFFDDGDDTNDRDVTIVDGNDSNFASTFDAAGWDATISNVAYGGGAANLQLHVSDGQSFEDGAVSINGTQLVAQGNNFQGDSVPGTFTGNPEGVTGNLWDIKGYAITNFMSSPTTTLNLTSPNVNDCISLVAAVVDVESFDADLSIAKTDLPDPVSAGEHVRYTVSVSNDGPDAATNVSVDDTVTNGTIVSATGTGWTCTVDSATQATCSMASLPSGATASPIQIDVQAPSSAGTITDTASVTADQSDPNQGDNSDQELTTVQAANTPDAATTFCADGCTLDTDPGTGATRTDPTVTFLIVPDDADPQTVTITEGVSTPTFCGGTPCNGQLVTITGQDPDDGGISGVNDPNDPMLAKLVFDKTVKGGTQIYINKPGFTTPQLVANCTTPGIASPHPCISTKIVLPNGDREITVLLLSGDPILGKK